METSQGMVDSWATPDFGDSTSLSPINVWPYPLSQRGEVWGRKESWWIGDRSHICNWIEINFLDCFQMISFGVVILATTFIFLQICDCLSWMSSNLEIPIWLLFCPPKSTPDCVWYKERFSVKGASTLLHAHHKPTPPHWNVTLFCYFPGVAPLLQLKGFWR